MGRTLRDRVGVVITDERVDEHWQLKDIEATMGPYRDELHMNDAQLVEALAGSRRSAPRPLQPAPDIWDDGAARIGERGDALRIQALGYWADRLTIPCSSAQGGHQMPAFARWSTKFVLQRATSRIVVWIARSDTAGNESVGLQLSVPPAAAPCCRRSSSPAETTSRSAALPRLTASASQPEESM